jgi:hypothetical protein
MDTTDQEFGCVTVIDDNRAVATWLWVTGGAASENS